MNLLTKLFGTTSNPNESLTAAEYHDRFVKKKVKHTLIDVREPAEFASGHVMGAKNIALQELAQRMNELPQDQPIVLYCRTGNRSGQAVRLLSQAGLTDLYNAGGLGNLANAGLPVTTPNT